MGDVSLRGMLGENPAYSYKDDNGCFIGPYAVLLYVSLAVRSIADSLTFLVRSHNPALIEPWIGLASSVTKQAIITPREKELVILAVTAVYDAPYVLYAHTAMALEIGLSQEQIVSASKAEVPNGLTSSEIVAYQTALKLAGGRRELDQASWEKACELLGEEKTAGVAHLVGGYIYTAILLNVGAIGAPE